MCCINQTLTNAVNRCWIVVANVDQTHNLDVRLVRLLELVRLDRIVSLHWVVRLVKAGPLGQITF